MAVVVENIDKISSSTSKSQRAKYLGSDEEEEEATSSSDEEEDRRVKIVRKSEE